MLNVLRESFRDQPYLRLVLLVVAVMLVVTLGVGTVDSCRQQAGEDWAARVNGVEIPAERLVATMQRMDRYYSEVLGENYEQFRPSLQLGRQAIEGLIDQEVVRQDAARLGLTNSPEELADHIRTNPTFADEAGRFIGAERYRELVNGSVPGGVEAFEQDIGNGLVAAKWESLVSQSVTVSEAELEQAFRQRTVKTAVDYVVLEAAAQDSASAVAETELQAWYGAHSEDYRRGEGWKIRYVVVDREAQRAKVAVSAEELQAYYDANQARYEHPEQRSARHILFRVEADATDAQRAAARAGAEAALARVQAGEDFATLARTVSQDPISADRGGDLGFFGQGQMVPPVEQAVFSTAVGQLAPLTDSPFGIHVIEVTGERPAGVSPLQDVEESIRRTLELQSAQQLTEVEAERLRQEIGSGDKLQETADRLGLTVTSRTVVGDEGLPDLGISADFLPALSALEPGALSAPLRIAAGMALVVVDERLPAAVAPLDEVRAQVEQAVRAERGRKAARAAAEHARERHDSVAAAARALGLELRSSGELTPSSRGLPASGGEVEGLAALLADDVQVGDRGVLEVPAGAIYYEVTSRTPFEPERFEQQKTTLRSELLGQRRQQFRQAVVQRLRTGQDITINQALLQRLS